MNLLNLFRRKPRFPVAVKAAPSGNLKLPPDFEHVATWDFGPSVDGVQLEFKHKASGRGICLNAVEYGPRPDWVAYMVTQVRRQYRRDRLYLAVSKDIERFRAAQTEMLARGYLI